MYLENIKGPDDVKNLDNQQLKALADEIRGKLIKTVSKNGGHLASNLGIVELTIGIHRVFDSPRDSVIFDVGHQSYVHKLLTGRGDKFDTIRTEGGLCGFMNPDESEHDPFPTGHSSTALSVGCGINDANRLSGVKANTIVVVGDGALTGGEAFEALNNSGSNGGLVVILNDNKMSISKNVGSLAKHLTKIRLAKGYIRFKVRFRRIITLIPFIGKRLEHFFKMSKTALKSTIYKSNYFESLGYYYIGPIDGNSIDDVLVALEVAKGIDMPVLVHACTVKGKGFALAEQSPTSYHGVSSFDYEVGLHDGGDNFSKEFGDALTELAENDNKVFAVTAAMTEGTGLCRFRQVFPERFRDVGIAEEHAVTYCSALASRGLKPVFAVYSSFLQRGYDQLIHDAALHDYNLTVCVDRAGIVGEDGATHQGLFDVAFLNSIPNVRVYSPSYYYELQQLIKRAVDEPGVAAVRYPRGKQPKKPDWYLFCGEDCFFHQGSDDVCVITYGRLFGNVAEAADRTGCSVIKLNTIKPIPEQAVEEAERFKRVIFYEEANRAGSVAEKLGCALLERGFKGSYEVHAVECGFVKQMTTDSAFKKLGFDTESIIKTVTGGKN